MENEIHMKWMYWHMMVNTDLKNIKARLEILNSLTHFRIGFTYFGLC